jgi:signal transduction histidine kinase
MELYSGSYERMELLYGVGSLGLIVAILLIYLVIVSLYKKTLRFAETTERNREIIQLGTAARTLAHEIKNPLGVIKLQCSTLSRVLPADYAASLQIIDTEAARMHELCDRIGDFLRSGAGQPERIDLAEALKQIAVKNGIGLESSLRPHAVVEIDRIRLESLLGNLIENALDASGRDPQKVRLVASSQGRNVSVDVVDQGPGVSAETAPRIFDLFFTTKARGSGIGLPVARRFAEAAGGNLALRDTGPGGSTFRLSLPLCPRRGAGK